MEKYFLHRIQIQNGTLSKGIEVHDTLAAAILSFHGRMKLAYGANPDVTFMSCKITDGSGIVLSGYNETYNANPGVNAFYLHYIRKDGDTITKGIDACASYGAAKAALHGQMEYGYDNTRFPGVNYVSCMITDMTGTVFMPETWEKASEPEPEEEP